MEDSKGPMEFPNGPRGGPKEPMEFPKRPQGLPREHMESQKKDPKWDQIESDLIGLPFYGPSGTQRGPWTTQGGSMGAPWGPFGGPVWP